MLQAAETMTSVYAAGATFLLVAAQWITAHMKGKKRDASIGEQLDRRLKPVTAAVDSLTLEVRDLKAHVVGPDGENGLRGDVREIRDKVNGLEERERERLEHKAYDRRSST